MISNPDRSSSSEFRSVRGPSVPEVVAERLRDAILMGRYKPGERLVEQHLAALFGIGQPTVREALRELEMQGFVRKNSNRGTYVTEFTQEDVRKHHEVRMALETLAIEKAAPHITPGVITRLEALLAEMELTVTDFDRATFHKLDMAFHRNIWECADNKYLTLALERITFSLFAFQLLERKPGDPVMTHVVEQHRQILRGLLTKDPVNAREIFRHATSEFWAHHQHVDARS